MHRLFAEQLVAICEAVCNVIRAQFIEVSLGPESQAAVVE